MVNFKPSIFNRIFLSMASVSVVLILIAVAVYSIFSTHLIENSIKTEIDRIKQGHVALFEGAYLSPLRNTLSMLSFSPSIEEISHVSPAKKTLVRFEIEKQLQQIIKLSEGRYASIRYVDNQGRENVVVEKNKRIRQFHDYTNLTNHQNFVDLYRQLELSTPGSIIFHPVVRKANNRIFYLTGISLSEPDIGGFGGAIIIENDLTKFQIQTDLLRFHQQPIARIITPSERDLNNKSLQFIPVQTSKDINTPYFYVEFQIPQQIINQQFTDILYTSLVIFLVTFGVIISLSRTLARRITDPVKLLLEGSQRLVRWNFSPIKTQSNLIEIDELSTSFNRMAQDLQDNLIQLEKDIERRKHLELELNLHRNELESLVQERTEKLEKLNNMFQIVLNSIPVRVFWKDQDLNYLGCNSLFAHDAGLDTPDDLISKSDFDMGWKANAESYRADDRLVMESNTPKLNYIEPQTTPDGDEIWLKTSKVPLFDNKDELIGMLGVYEDITRAKQNEIALAKAKQQAQEANIAKGQFLANMSHEIRTPLNAVIGMTHLALKTGLDEKQHNFVHKANLSAEHLLGIINDILDFSKIESGKLELESIPFKISDVLKNMLNIARFKAEEKGIRIKIQLDQDIPKHLMGDPLRIGQVLLNFVNNAIKFSHADSSIEINVNLNKIKQDQVHIQFSVKDDGIGMNVEQQQKLFQPFTQADTSTSRKYGGTGLGLVISQNLIHLMSGKVWVESQENLGSTFSFTLSLKKSAQQKTYDSAEHEDSQELDQALAQLKGLNILLVEDNELNQELARELLVHEGITVETAFNGKEALELLEQQSFDGILMDCQMPVMDGYEATKYIRESKIYKDIPIVAMTANAMPQDVAKVLAAGMNDHIAKPINPEIMFCTMAKWFKG